MNREMLETQIRFFGVFKYVVPVFFFGVCASMARKFGIDNTKSILIALAFALIGFINASIMHSVLKQKLAKMNAD